MSLSQIEDLTALMGLFSDLAEEHEKLCQALPRFKGMVDETTQKNYENMKALADTASAEMKGLSERIERIHASIDEEGKKQLESQLALRERVRELGQKLTGYEQGLTVLVDERVQKAMAMLPVPEVKPAEPGRPGKDASLAASYRGNWDAQALYKRDDVFTFRGASYLVLRESRGIMPDVDAQKGPKPRYGLLSAAGAPGNSVQGPAGTIASSYVAPPLVPATALRGQWSYDAGRMYWCVADGVVRTWTTTLSA